MVDGLAIPDPGVEALKTSASLNPQIAKINLAKDLSERMATDFFCNGLSGGVRVPPEITVGCLEDAIRMAAKRLQGLGAELYISSDLPLCAGFHHRR